ncbi:hypothetical protein N7495_001835 [Penicillium taxi]|uniref:uncharacterized protein n=1 Tax=Penicillium taxi TaxID=168475 RepID=UPI0025458423|nr:uncharacterized protein N7495_001835 [Penicillium taxi]KAJ5909153.1 hypothetical protein N7495_001835 [Penicillium taxi]
MSRQYLAWGAAEKAHPADIFSVAVGDKQVLTASGGPSIKVHSTVDTEFPLVQSFEAHKVGCHHVVTDASGKHAVTTGFGGESKVWYCEDGHWSEDLPFSALLANENLWASVFSLDAQLLAGITPEGRIGLWHMPSSNKARDYETNGNVGTCIDMSPDQKLIASGYANGAVCIIKTEDGRMPFSLAGLVKPVRTVAFSPGGRLLAAAGDAGVIVLYDTTSGEQIATLLGNTAWVMSLSWSDSGENLLSSSFDGKLKVWNVETKTCVATNSINSKAIWSAKWLPKSIRDNAFVAAGAHRSVAFYREATGA